MSEDCHVWDKTEETWITADFNWNEICVAVEVIGAGRWWLLQDNYQDLRRQK